MKIFQKLLSLLIIFSLILIKFSVKAESTPTLIDVNKNGNEGDYYIGDIPENLDLKKPVLVFVQGMGGRASDWWAKTHYYGNNDMYHLAYTSGFRTAFVNLRDSDGTNGDLWRNGEVLSNELKEICNYYKVSKVDLICHSKGGIDAQSAIVYYGANKYVDKVFTLSTPHHGSQLADLCYSWYGSPLADLVGEKNDGTYILQTSYMSYFRSITDNRSENDNIKYYTSAGTNWGPTFSGLWLGGCYLSQFGINDGLVTVESAHNPRAYHINTSDLNHDSIRIGSNVWWYLEPKILEKENSSIKSTDEDLVNKQYNNTLLKGGTVTKSLDIKIPVDSTSKSVTINLISSNSSAKVKLTSADREYSLDKNTLNDVFKGTASFVKKVDSPKSGYMNLNINTEKPMAYVLIINYDCEDLSNLIAKSTIASGDSLNMNFNFARNIKNLNYNIVICKSSEKQKTQKIMDFNIVSYNRSFNENIIMPKEPGLYNLTTNITGFLEDGSPYERSFISSVIVENKTLNKLENLRNLKY